MGPREGISWRWTRRLCAIYLVCMLVRPSYSTDLMDENVRFSFRATTTSGKSQTQNYFVAFDGLNRMVRVDSQTRHNLRISSHYYSQQSTKILDLKTNRKYVVDKSEPPPGADNSTSVNRCVVTYLDSPGSNKYQVMVNLRLFLFGGTNLGFKRRERVRDIDARVYDVELRELPDWYAPPLVFSDKYAQPKAIKEAEAQLHYWTGKHQPTLKGTLYLSEEYGAMDAAPLTREVRPLRYVISVSNATAAAAREVLSIEFSHFYWQLSEAPGGDQVESLFSLGHLCTAAGDTYRQISMMVSAPPDMSREQLDWLAESPRLRNDALRTSVSRALGIRPPSIGDLSSRIVRSRAAVSILVKLEYYELRPELWTLQYVGGARFTGRVLGVKIIRANSIVDCLWALGASPQLRRIFYMSDIASCIVETREALGHFSDYFEMGSYPDALYLVSSREDASAAESWISRRRPEHLEGRALLLADVERLYLHPKDRRDVEMSLGKIRISRASGASSSPESQVLGGFALQELGGVSRRLAAGSETASWDRCEAACLREPDCESFSFCARLDDGDAPQCVLATRRAVTPELVRRLSEEEVALAGATVRVQLAPDAELELRRDFRCELHNKNHLRLYRRAEPVEFAGSVGRATSAAECAAECFARSMDAVAASAALHQEIRALIDGQPATDGKQLRATVARLSERHRDLVADFCSGFAFLEPRGAGPVESSPSACVLMGNASSGQVTASRESDFYRFDFSSLYERHDGFILRRSPVSEEELNAYRLVSGGGDVGEAQLRLVARLVQQRKNLVRVAAAASQPSECASQCFSAAGGVWPACGSFDVRVNELAEEANALICQLNTESLAGGDRPELRVDERPDYAHINYAHFEPRFLLAAALGADARQLERWAAGLRGHAHLSDARLGVAALLLLLAAGMAGGWWAGGRAARAGLRWAGGGRASVAYVRHELVGRDL